MSERLAAVWAWIMGHKLISGAILVAFVIVLWLMTRSGSSDMGAADGYTVGSGGYYVPGPSDAAIQANLDLQTARYSADANTAAVNAQVGLAAHQSDNDLSGHLAELQTGLLATLGGQQLLNAHDLGLATIDASVSTAKINSDERTHIDDNRTAEGFDVRRQQDYGQQLSYNYNYALNALQLGQQYDIAALDSNERIAGATLVANRRSGSSFGISIPNVGSLSFGSSRG